MNFKMADLSFRIFNSVMRNLSPENIYLDTKINCLGQMIKEILTKIEILSNNGGHLGFQDG